MIKTAPAVAAILALASVLPAFAAPTKDEIGKALKDNPNLILDVLKDHKKELFDIMLAAQQEEQARRQQEAEEQQKKELEENFKNPKKPEITSKTRVRGNKDAKITVVEYSDFQCPYCARGFNTVEELRKKYGGNLRFIYKNMPLPFHPQAMPAAKWFEAVALQSPEKAWQFHDTMFKNQDKLGTDFFKETVKNLGLDVAKAEKDANSQAVADKIEKDSAEGKSMGFDGTPGFLVNGIEVKGAYPLDYFDMIIARLEGKKPAEEKD